MSNEIDPLSVRPIGHVLLKIRMKKDLPFAEYDHVKSTLTSGDLSISMVHPQFDAAMYVPNTGEVVSSCVKDILPGDFAHVEYFALLNAFGRWFNSCAQVDDPAFFISNWGVYAFVKPHNVYFVEREGRVVTVNGYNIVEVIKKPMSKVFYGDKIDTLFARVLHGDYAGKVVIFSRFADQGYTPPIVIKNDYILAEIENFKEEYGKGMEAVNSGKEGF